jgi:putative selenate reductase
MLAARSGTTGLFVGSMAELTPYPLAALARRMFRELERDEAIFDLPRERFFLGDPEHDYSVRLHGRRVSSPLGPAAGPHTQMAQNVVLSWLGGARVMELKTVQILDQLEIPRPCIDMRTVGFNAEWSQELALEQSLAEYVKAAMLIELLQQSGVLDVAAGFDDLAYDMSVGYDLAGIESERVLAFVRGMLDVRPTVERLRRELPAELGPLRDCAFRQRLSDTVTLSTFHGCPPHEIEQIIRFLMEELGLHCVIKFNPMLLGPEEARGLLHDELGYGELRIPDSAFERDATWEQAVEIVERLEKTARERGVGLGVKFSNTLIVENDQGFLPASEKEVYLSGPPLHVLAMHLARRFRRHFGDRLPISFSAGIDRLNYPDAVALGLVPITVCSDLLQKGGYGRLHGYHAELAKRMDTALARDVAGFVLRAYGQAEAALDGVGTDEDVKRRCHEALRDGGDLRAAAGEGVFEDWVSATKLLNTERYVGSLAHDARYARERNAKMPRKIGRHLKLFDCLTCDICVPVCPNDANFTFRVEGAEIPVVKLVRAGDGWEWRQEGVLRLEERHQIGNFADFCNDCGNCDVFCPEDGGPYVVKPRFFRRREDWAAAALDGFQMERRDDREVVRGRIEGVEYELEVAGTRALFAGAGFRLELDLDSPADSVRGEGAGDVDFTWCLVMDRLRRAILHRNKTNYVNALAASEAEVG